MNAHAIESILANQNRANTARLAKPDTQTEFPSQSAAQEYLAERGWKMSRHFVLFQRAYENPDSEDLRLIVKVGTGWRITAWS